MAWRSVQTLLRVGCWMVIGASFLILPCEVRAITFDGLNETNPFVVNAGLDTVSFINNPSIFQNNLTISSSSGIDQQIFANVSVSGNANLTSTGDILLSNVGNDFDSVSAVGGSVGLADSDSLNIALVQATNFSIEASNALTITNLIALSGTLAGSTVSFNGLLSLELNQQPANALVNLNTPNILLGGDLQIGGAMASGLTTGSVFNIFDFMGSPTISGQYSNVTLPTLANGLTWDTSDLLVSGNISIQGNIVPPVPEPSTMLLLVTGLVGLIGWQYRKIHKR